MYGLDLFSGIGGITKALEPYVQPVAYCENDRYAQAVLLSRMRDGLLPCAPIWDDVTTLRAESLPLLPDIIYGGFPCQDISVAGRGEGLDGKRSGLFFEIARLIGEIRPRFVFLENVPAIRLRGGNTVVGTLAGLGYDCRWDLLSAADMGANHERERWWLLAHARHGGRGNVGALEGREDAPKERSSHHHATGRSGEQSEVLADAEKSKIRTRHGKVQTGEKKRPIGPGDSGTHVADSNSPGLGERWGGESDEAKHHPLERTGENVPDSAGDERRIRNGDSPADGNWWAVEPAVGRVAHGVPLRVDRLRALGNSVVPAQAREAFERLMGLNRRSI